MLPYADAGPLYGLVLPILISVSDAPGSYFFCASAGKASAVASTAAAGRNMGFTGRPPWVALAVQRWVGPGKAFLRAGARAACEPLLRRPTASGRRSR